MVFWYSFFLQVSKYYPTPPPLPHPSQIAFPNFWKLDEEWNTSNRTGKDVWIASLMIIKYKSQSALDRCHMKYSNLKCYVLLQVQVFLLIFTYHQTTWNYNFLFREYVKYIGPWSCIVKNKNVSHTYYFEQKTNSWYLIDENRKCISIPPY